MRFNRGTILFVAALLVVIIGALAISNFQATAPGEATPTPGVETGALLPIEAAGAITQMQVIDTLSGDFTTLARADATWTIDGSYAQADRDPQASLIDTTADNLVALEYTSQIADATELEAFGLASPARVIVITAGADVYTIYVGDRAPTSPRYYVIVQAGAPDLAPPPEATAEVTPEATVEATVEATAEVAPEVTPDLLEEFGLPTPALTPVRLPDSSVTLTGTYTVYAVPQSAIDTLFGWLLTPPYAPPTPTLIPLPTLEATVEITPEATAELETTTELEATPEVTDAP